MKKLKFATCFLCICAAVLFAACGSDGSVKKETETQTSAKETEASDRSEPMVKPMETDTDTGTETQSAATPAGEAVNEQYLCRIDGKEHRQLTFFYENKELVKVEYILQIKGMPEEIEERKRLESYSGVEMVDGASCIVFEIDVKAGGSKYLKDTVPFLSDADDWRWENVKDRLEHNGYQILECSNDDILKAEETAQKYYQKTVFTVLQLYVKEAGKEKIVFGVHCSKGDEIVDPDRSITVELINGEWVETNEGY